MALANRFTPCLVVAFFLSGCAANDLMVKRQSESEAKIEYLIQSTKKVEQRHNEFAGLFQSQEERFQAINKELKQLKDENSELRTSREELKARLASLVQQLQTPKVEVVNQPSPTKTLKESGPPTEYVKAFGLYSANSFAAAIEAFDLFIKNNPQSDYAANATYWIGECHYSLSDLAKAKEVFTRVTENYPNSSKTPDAFLKLGYTLSALKEADRASEVFEKIITTYPSNPVAIKARERLNAR